MKHVLGKLIFSFSLLFHSSFILAQEPKFTLYPDNPVITRGTGESWDRGFLDPGTVIYHDGSYHMLYVAIPNWPHPLAIGYAKSENGYDWTKQSSTPVLSPEQTGNLVATSIMSSSALVTEEGEWILYFTSIAEGENFYGNIARASAPNPTGPWQVDPEPVLSPGPEGAWDVISVGDASVVRTDTGYSMYYAGFGTFQNGAFAEKRANIGLATSEDGMTWRKYNDPQTTDALWAASDPVFMIDTNKTSWESFRIVDPNVQKTPEGWLMAYAGSSFDSSKAIGLATSEDGITWHRSSDKPLLTPEDVGAKLYFVTLLSRPDQDFLYFEMGGTSGTDGYLAVRSRG